MLSTVITTLLLLFMVMMIAALIFTGWREHRRYKQTVAAQSSDLPPHRFDSHVTAVLHVHEGTVVNVEPFQRPPSFFLPSSWYKRRRILVSFGFLVMIALTLFVQDTLAGGNIHGFSKGLGLSFLGYNAPVTVQPAAHVHELTPSERLVRVNSADRKQYYTDFQYNVWAWSSCSGIAMEMVMNSYGRQVIAADVLQVEADLGVWNTDLGLLREDGIAMAADHFGFDTDAGHTRTIDEVIALANKGAPMIVSVRDPALFPGGHLLVVRGGDDQFVYLADSSAQNFTRMDRAVFIRMWQGFSALLKPRA